MPVQIYPIFETALRLAAGETIGAHQRRVAESVAGFSAVAAANPEAWDQRVHTAAEIATPGPTQPLDRVALHEAHGRLRGRGHGRRPDPHFGGDGDLARRAAGEVGLTLGGGGLPPTTGS